MMFSYYTDGMEKFYIGLEYSLQFIRNFFLLLFQFLEWTFGGDGNWLQDIK